MSEYEEFLEARGIDAERAATCRQQIADALAADMAQMADAAETRDVIQAASLGMVDVDAARAALGLPPRVSPVRTLVEFRSQSCGGILHTHDPATGPCTEGCITFPPAEQVTTMFHDPMCSMWHHQGGDYDRDCAACMALCAAEQGKPYRMPVVHTGEPPATCQQCLAGVCTTHVGGLRWAHDGSTIGTHLEER